ncbi:MAG: trimethylamine methyltransferase family protein [Deltaproteobacteria bacterium]|jgi:trimethylamine--corrinoid protein Co-methyltransferase|nr:trimethylamine methyltransferase family protein [Deltaproteobacteria bacterium]
MTLRKFSAGFKSSGGFSLNVFTPDEFAAIHRSTLEVLSEVGVFVQKREAREIFRAAGARIYDDGLVKIPPHLVEEAIRSAPSTLTLAGRDKSRDIVIEGGRVSFTNFGEGICIIDHETGELRSTTKNDLATMTRLLDSLDVIGVIERAVGSQDKPAPMQAIHNYEAMINNTNKHCFLGPENGHNVEIILAMAAEAVGGPTALRDRCPVSFITCPVSPLRLVEDCCEIIMSSAENGAAVCILSMAMAGGSSPVHLAGTLVNHNAEILAGITLAQLTNKGAKVIYGSSSTAMYLKNASAVVGTPELAMINAAVAAMARYYLLPSWVAGG